MRCTVLVYKIVKINALNRKKGNINSATYFEIANNFVLQYLTAIL